MTFFSTRGGIAETSFRDAVFEGLAPDGGLYHPTSFSDLSQTFRNLSMDIPFAELSAEIIHRLFAEDFSRQTVDKIIRRAFTFSPVMHSVDDQITFLELFHGPSYAFKDFGASFLASCMEEFLTQSGQSAVILVATSGDTGSAVARAFHKKRNIDVVILYPSGRVSPLQEKQLTTLSDNVSALEVKGSFDDCQKMAKEAFLDRDLKERLSLTSANSINLGRLIPQSLYYAFAYTRLGDVADEGLSFCVPSGNFGNLTAGVYAWKWGLPVKGFVAATNINDVVPEYLSSGLFEPRPSVRTLSNAMDVGNPSNFERLLALFNGNRQSMAQTIKGEVVEDKDTLEAISEVWKNHGFFIDPHTAVGYLAARRRPQRRHVVLATAHPAKFQNIVERATGRKPELPEELKALLTMPKRSSIVEVDGLRNWLLGRFA